jgi:phospholipid transport system substrate-binding protein
MMASIKSLSALLTLVGLLGWWVAPADAAVGSASDTVRAFQGELLAAMQNATALGTRGRFQKLEPVVQGSFDVPFMTKMAIGLTWDSLSPEQKQQASHAFGRYVTATYARQFDGYSGERFTVLSEQKIQEGVLVRTRLVKSSGEAILITYLAHENETAWQIRDIYLSDTISELATRRSEFSSILRTQGIDGLIAALNRKADELV